MLTIAVWTVPTTGFCCTPSPPLTPEGLVCWFNGASGLATWLPPLCWQAAPGWEGEVLKKRETKSKARPAEGAICFFEEGEGQDLGQASRTEEEVIKLILQLQDLADTLAGSGAQIDALLGSAHRLEQSLVLPGDAVRNKRGVG